MNGRAARKKNERSAFSGPFGGEALLTAAKDDDADAIDALVQLGGIPVNWSNKAGQTALHVAALWANPKAIKALVRLGAPLEAPNDLTGATPLHLAAIGRASYAKKMRAMKLLLDAGASGKAEDKFGAPVWYYADDEEMRVMLGGPVFELHKAIIKKDLNKLSQLLTALEYPDQVNQVDTDGNTPLHLAAASAFVSGVKTLLASGAEPDERNEDGATPLHISVCALDREISELLLKAKASPDIRSLCIDEYHSKNSSWVVIDGAEAADRGASFSLSSRGRKDLEKREVSCEDESPLHVAVQKGSLDLTRLLLDHGASVDLPDLEEKTALHHALETLLAARHAEATTEAEAMVRLLLDRGADPRKGNKDFGRYRSTLHWIVMEGHLPALKLILSYNHESLIDFKDQQGFTPLMLACRAGKLDCVLTLLQHGADFSILNGQGMSPRNLAAVNGRLQVVAALDAFVAEHSSI